MLAALHGPATNDGTTRERSARLFGRTLREAMLTPSRGHATCRLFQRAGRIAVILNALPAVAPELPNRTGTPHSDARRVAGGVARRTIW
jgi:hypothetical protein